MSYTNLQKDDRIGFRLPKSMKEELEEIAKREHRKLGDLIFLVLCEYLEEQSHNSGLIANQPNFQVPESDDQNQIAAEQPSRYRAVKKASGKKHA